LFVVCVKLTPVNGFESFTIAPGTTAPELSVTVPVMDEESCALSPDTQNMTKDSNTNDDKRKNRFMNSSRAVRDQDADSKLGVRGFVEAVVLSYL
jgi:hypothetical protein